jgi:hypothetical protein
MITIIALILVTVGALNWLSVGIFNFNVINWMFTPSAYVGARIVYALVGIAGVWLIAYLIYNKFSPKRIHAVEDMKSDHDHTDRV